MADLISTFQTADSGIEGLNYTGEIKNSPLIMGLSQWDNGTVGATSQDLPATNMLNTQPRRLWRSTDTQKQVLYFDAGESNLVSALYIGNHNFSGNSLITWELSDTSDFSDILYTATEAGILPLVGLGLDPMGSNQVGIGGYADAQFSFSQSIHFVQRDNTSNQVLPVYCRYIRLTIEDTGNRDGYIEIGRVKFGTWVQSDKGLSFNYSFGGLSDTQIIKSRGGAMRAIPKPNYREANCLFNFLTEDESVSFTSLLWNTRATDVLLIAMPNNKTELGFINTFLGRITKSSLISIPHEIPEETRLFSLTMTITESI